MKVTTIITGLIGATIMASVFYANISLAQNKQGRPSSAEDVERLLEIYQKNNATPWNINEDAVAAATCTPNAISGIDTATSSGGSNIEIVLKVMMNAGMTLAQASGVVGNLIVESGSTSINPAAEEFPGQDKGGYGIVQWTGSRWRGPKGLREFAKFRNTEWSNLNTQLEFILWEVGKGISWNGDSGGSEKSGWNATLSTTTPEAAAEAWMLRYERPGVPHLDKRISHAKEVYEKFQNNSLSNIDVNSTDCQDNSTNDGGVVSDVSDGSSSAIASSVAGTAKRLAWPHRVQIPRSTAPRYGESASKPEYVAEVVKFTKNFHDAEFTDCGIFVAAVMRSSGVDPKYPVRGTTTQLSYVKNSPLYKTFTAKSESELQPGDILVRPGHTYIYVGPYQAPKDGKTYKAVGASWHTRPPSGHSLYLSGNSSSDISHSSAFTIARYIGN